jgi:signal transduction histidine kinase
VCYRLVEAMSGRIWAQTRPDGGTEFMVALPIAALE